MFLERKLNWQFRRVDKIRLLGENTSNGDVFGIRHFCSFTNGNHGVVPSPVRSVGTNTIASKLAKAMRAEADSVFAPAMALA